MSQMNVVSEVNPDFTLLSPVKYKIRRVNTKQGRFYLTESGVFISNTSLIDMTTPLEDALIRKMCERGYDEWMKFLNERANYGTILHILIGEFLISKKINFDRLGDRVAVLFDQYKIDKSKYFVFYEDLCQDLLAFAQFASDFKIKPIAVELPLVSNIYGFAGTIDLVCEMTIKEKGFFGDVYKSGEKKGEPKESTRDVEINAIIDFKSGRHGFTERHSDQLELCRLLVKENYKDFYSQKKIRLFNWSPKAWRSEPGYNLKDQTGNTSSQAIFAKITLAKEKVSAVAPTYLSSFGELELGDEPGMNWDYKKVFDIKPKQDD